MQMIRRGHHRTLRIIRRYKDSENLNDAIIYCKSIRHDPRGSINPRTRMVERFNGRIADILKKTRFRFSEDLKKNLFNYLYSYNFLIIQRALKEKSAQASHNSRSIQFDRGGQ